MPAFTPGNLVVYRVGDGIAALSGAAAAVFLDEYTTAGVFVRTHEMPVGDGMGGAGNQTLTAVGNATSEGWMTLSVDGRYLIVPGYDAAPGTASLAASASATFARVIGRVAADGTYDTTTALTNVFSGQNIRGVASIDGTTFWAVGSGTGVVTATFNATTGTVIATTPNNLRTIEIFNSQLYEGSSAGAIRIGTVGSGTPTTPGQTITSIPGFPTATVQPNQFFFADLDGIAGLDTLYVSDDRASGSGGGISKYSLFGGSWVLNGTANGSIRGLTASVSGTTVALYGTTSAATNAIVSLIDTSGYNAAFSSTTFTTLATAAAGTFFRGIAFAPSSGPQITIQAAPVAHNEGDAGSTAFVFTISRSSGTGTATVDYAVTGMGGLDANDFVGAALPAGTATFSGTDLTTTITINVNGDLTAEATENFTVTLSNASAGYTLGTPSAQTGTITDDDSHGSISVDSPSAAEGDTGTTPGSFTLTRSGGSVGTVTVDYVITLPGGPGGADGTDVSATLAGTVTFLNGETSATIPYTVSGDRTVEPDETFTIELSNATGGAIIGTANGTATITNDDVAGTVSVGDVSILEGDSGQSFVTVTLTRTGGSGDFSVNYDTADISASDGQDYQGVTGTANFTDGATTATFQVAIDGDTISEGDETFSVTLSGETDGAIIGDGTGIVTITDDEGAGSVSIGDASVTESDSGTVSLTFTLTRSGGSAPFAVTVTTSDDSATEPGDYAANSETISFGANENVKTFTVTVNGDTDIEPDETLFATLSAPTNGATIGTGTATGTIVTDDFITSVSIADASIIEGESGTSILQLTVTRSGGTAAFSVDFATSNGGNPNNASATAGSDYAAQSGTLVFGIGQNTATIDIVVNGDDIDELSEELTITLSNATNGASLVDATAIGTITTDDTGPAGPPGVWINEFHYDNSGTDTGEFIEIAGVAGTDLSEYSIVRYNQNGQVYTSPSATETFSGTIPNQAGGYGAVRILYPTDGLQNGANDGFALVRTVATIPTVIEFLSYEGTTTAVNGPANGTTSTDVGVSEPGSASGTSIGRLGGPTSPFVLISDDSPGQLNSGQLLGATPTVAVSDVSVNEAAGTMTFTVTRTNVVPGAFTVAYATANGTATAGSDYSATSGTLSFTDNQVQALVTVTIADDGAAEFDETLFLNLSNPTGGAVISDNQAVGTIVNDDGTPITVSIGDVIQAEGTSGTTLFTFNVVRSGGTGAFDINFETANGSATVVGNDYLANSGILNFGVGENIKTISVTVNGDMTPEPVENFFVNLSNATNNVIVTDASGTGTILDGAGTLNFIHDIQGTAYFSPLLTAESISSFNVATAAFVTVQAVVTAIDNDGDRQGFYIQEQVTDWDGNNFTSEGIFVMTRNDSLVGTTVSGVAVGDLVTVSAQVMEYQGFSTNMPITVLANPSAIVVQSSGNVLPILLLDAGHPIPNAIMTQVTPDYTDSADGVGDTFDASLYGLSFWETVEGMLVTIPDMVVADGFVSTSGGRPFLQAYSTVHADADQINSRGGYTIAGDPPFGPPDTGDDAEDGTVQGGRHLHDGDVNPDIIELDWTGWADAPPTGLTQNATMGEQLGDVTGIVEFDHTDRKLFVTDMEPGGFVNGGIPVRETTGLGGDGRALTVATFNVENLDPGDGAARFTALANTIATNLNAPDIICIEEMQDNNGASASGGADASTTWQTLVNALNLATGANYQWVDQEPVAGAEGGEPGGNIRVGFLYNTDRVQLGNLDASATLTERRMYTDRIGDGTRDGGDLIAYSDNMLVGEINTADWTTTRKSLLGEFTFNGNTVYVTANHWPAKGGSGEFWQFNQNIATGDPDNSDWAQRNEVGQDVWAMMNLIQTGNPNAGIVAGGDFNDFYFYQPLTTVTGHTLANGTARVGGARFENLTLTLSEGERYTYTFDGRSQAIDHVIVNSLLGTVATYDVVHINTGYNRNGTGPDASPRLSDHDPALSSFDYRDFSEVLVGTAGNDVIEGFGGNDTIYGGLGNDFLDGNVGTDRLEGGAGDDTLVVDNAGDVVIELSGEGRDIIYTSISYEIGAALDVEILAARDQSAVSALVLVGNGLGQEIYGNAGANFLEGGGGVDYLIGLGGDDGYVVDGSEDVVIEAGAGGTDIVYARGDYTLSAGAAVEILSSVNQGATTPATLIGNAFGQTIYGNAGANFIEGGGGADLLVGLGGDDVYVVDSASDYVAESGGGGTDVVYAKTSYALAAGQEVEVLSTVSQAATTAIDLTGNELANQILGNAGANVLNGGAGGDFLFGLGGADTFAFTTALGGGNVDHIGDFLAVDDTIALDDAVFTGLAPGALNANAFVLGTAAGDADDRIIYDQASGQLWFDADGNGAGAKVLFAILDSNPVLTASDFAVI